MSERIYACLMRLFPMRFRREYTEEALQLLRDRLRDERGVSRRMRLWLDLIVDLGSGLSLAWRNCEAVETTAAVSMNGGGGAPCFRMLEGEPLRPASIFWGSTLTVLALIAFGFLMSRAASYAPQYVSQAPESPINAVMERLNRANSTESIGGGNAANAQTGAGTNTAPSSDPVSMKAAGDFSPRPVPEASGAGPAGAIPFETWAPQRRASGSVAIAAMNARGGQVAANVGQAHPIAQAQAAGQAHPTAQAGSNAQVHPENAVKAMMQLFHSHDVVMFGEVHGTSRSTSGCAVW